jgi:hypothetical protein
MFITSHSTEVRRTRRTSARPRRGVALVFVLVFVIAMAALAMSSIFMASNANLLAKSYDRERDLKYAAEAALAIGKSRVNSDPGVLVMRPGQIDSTIMSGVTLTGANGQPLAGIIVNVYVGPSGSTSGQFGRFSSIIAEARDTRGNGYIRRLELTQESFAKFAYWSNSESNGSTTIFFNNGDVLFGPVWSNDTISIGSGGASFRDEVGTVFFVAGANYGTFSKGYKQYQKPIVLPSITALNNLTTISATSGWNFASVATASQNENSVRDRIEFLAVDLANTGDSLALNDGLFRIFTANSDLALRGDYPPGSPPSVGSVQLCGDWHFTRDTTNANPASGALRFYPATVHDSLWFFNQVKQGYQDQGNSASTADNLAKADTAATLTQILTKPNARCYLAGDSHLVAVERRTTFIDPHTATNYKIGVIRKGGTDTTFTPVGANGSWKVNPAAPATIVNARRSWDAPYLFPIDRLYNANAKGVIHFGGNVGVSGTLNGRITLYATGSLVLLDDIRYANDPVKGVCRDILGMISGKDIVIADNALNTPQKLTSSTTNFTNLDDTKDFTIHGVMMALGSSFRVQNYNNTNGPNATNNCAPSTINGRGCIYLSGGIIQQARGPVGQSSGEGFAKRYSYDKCAVVNPPPYFPTTGRFLENRYLELDPAGFSDTTYFKSIVPDP